MQIRGRRIYLLGSMHFVLIPFHGLPPCCMCPAPVLPTRACLASQRTCRLLRVLSQNSVALVMSLPSAQTALVKVSTAQSFPIRSGSPPRTCGSLRVRRGSPWLHVGCEFLGSAASCPKDRIPVCLAPSLSSLCWNLFLDQ